MCEIATMIYSHRNHHRLLGSLDLHLKCSWCYVILMLIEFEKLGVYWNKIKKLTILVFKIRNVSFCGWVGTFKHCLFKNWHPSMRHCIDWFAHGCFCLNARFIFSKNVSTEFGKMSVDGFGFFFVKIRVMTFNGYIKIAKPYLFPQKRIQWMILNDSQVCDDGKMI